MDLKLSKNILANNEKFNSITKNKGIFGSNDVSLKFDHNMKSVDLPNYFFINFMHSSNKIYKDFMRKEIKKIENNNIDLLEEYNDKLIGVNTELRKKLEDIYYETYGKRIRLPYLKRLTKIGNEGFQLYYCKESEDNYLIILVDLYHLIIPAADKSHHEKKKNPEKTYNENKSANYDIANFF